MYENWISLLYKYPWFAVDHVKLKERRMIWDGTDSLMRILMENLRRPDLNKRHNVIPPSPALLQELTVAALTCPGFSEKQKAFLVFRLHTENWGHMAQGTNLNIKLSGTHIMAEWWPFTALGIHTATDLSFVHVSLPYSEFTIQLLLITSHSTTKSCSVKRLRSTTVRHRPHAQLPARSATTLFRSAPSRSTMVRMPAS